MPTEGQIIANILLVSETNFSEDFLEFSKIFLIDFERLLMNFSDFEDFNLEFEWIFFDF